MYRRVLMNLGYLALAVMLFAAPVLLTSTWSTDAPWSSATDPNQEAPRLIDRVLGVEGWASEGFAGLSAEIGSRDAPPTWGELRQVMERRGCTDLRYALTIRLVMVDGGVDERTIIRRPYTDPINADEFLRYLKAGPDAAVWVGPGDPPWKVEGTAEASDADGLPRRP